VVLGTREGRRKISQLEEWREGMNLRIVAPVIS